MSIRRYCRIFLLSFDAHFFVFCEVGMFKFSSYIGDFEPKFPAVFFCRNKGVRKYALLPEHIGRQRRPFKGLWGFLLRCRVAQIFRATMAFCTKICVRLRITRLRFAVVKLFAKTFKKRWIYRDFCGIVCANERRFLWQQKSY